jgi:hypothetical protein
MPFRRMPDGWHRRASWIFEGIEDEILGDFGLAHGAAGGLEIDRYDLSLGTPPQARGGPRRPTHKMQVRCKCGSVRDARSWCMAP